MRRTRCFNGESYNLENSLFGNKTNINSYNGNIRKPLINPSKTKEINQLFKIPTSDNIPVKRVSVKAILSPKASSFRMKNDTGLSQQSRMTFVTRPSFVNSRKTIHNSKTNKLNSRREVIKKMILLAESAVKDNTEFKQSTPLKLIGMTPKKTPKSNKFLMVPEFKKMGIKSDFESPTESILQKSRTYRTPGRTPKVKEYLMVPEEKFGEDMDLKSPLEPPVQKSTPKSFVKDTTVHSSFESKPSVKFQVKEIVTSNCSLPVYGEMLRYCRIYNTEVELIYGKLRMVEDCFERNIRDLPEQKVYDEFCLYQKRKEELYNEIKSLEEKFKESIENKTVVAKKLKDYIKKRKELFDKRKKLHQSFEEVVKSALENYNTDRVEVKKNNKNSQIKEEEIKENEEEEEIEEKENVVKEETSKLRRSLRLSKIQRSKFDENTPMSKKLKKLDSKSRGIKKSLKPSYHNK